MFCAAHCRDFVLIRSSTGLVGYYCWVLLCHALPQEGRDLDHFTLQAWNAGNQGGGYQDGHYRAGTTRSAQT